MPAYGTLPAASGALTEKIEQLGPQARISTAQWSGTAQLRRSSGTRRRRVRAPRHPSCSTNFYEQYPRSRDSKVHVNDTWGLMRFGRCVPSFVAAVALAVVVGACVPDGGYDGQGIAGKGGASGAAGNRGGGGGSAGSGGGNVGQGGSAGSVTGSGGSTGVAGTSGGGGTTGSGGSTGAGGGSGSAGADGTAGASGSTGTGGAGQAGRGGAGAGGAVAGRGGGAGVAGSGGSGGASGAAGSGAAGSGGSGTTMRSPGCGKTPTLTSGTRTIQSSGQSRSYILRIPDNYDNSHPYRLIFGYHWNGGTMQDIDGGGTSGATWSYYGLRAQANNSTIFVAPQGIGNGWGNSGGQDLKLTDDMIELDRRRSLRGHDAGLRLGLQLRRRDELRAGVRAPGGLPRGSGLLGRRSQRVRRRHAARRVHRHSRHQRRNAEHLRRALDAGQVRHEQRLHRPEPARAESRQPTHTCTTYQGCKAGYPVEWCAFDGGHTPGIVDGGGDDGARTWTKTEVWKFFSQFQ